MRRIGIVGIDPAGAPALESAIHQVGQRADYPVSVCRVQQPEEAKHCWALILPGVLSFTRTVRALQGSLEQMVREHLGQGKPCLGIAAGLQALLEHSDEDHSVPGLGLLPGRCRAVPRSKEPFTGTMTHVPHLGWNRMMLEQHAPRSLCRAVRQGSWSYFAQTHMVCPTDPSHVVATVEHGTEQVPAIVVQQALWGVEFRPERSGRTGLRLLEAFVTQA